MAGAAVIDCADQNDVAKLYSHLRPYAVSKVDYLLGDASAAQDIVHDVFAKLWVRRLRFETVQSAYAWVYAACHNAAIDHLRSRKRAGVRAKGLAALPAAAPTTPQERVANRALLEAALGRLSDREAQVLAYRIIDGMTYKDTAAMMGLSDKTVQRILASIDAKLSTLRSLA